MSQVEDMDIKELAGLIAKDPALAGKILKTVNSSFYGDNEFEQLMERVGENTRLAWLCAELLMVLTQLSLQSHLPDL